MNWPSAEPSLFGIPLFAPAPIYREIFRNLNAVWADQLQNGPKALRHPSAPLPARGTEHEVLSRDLHQMKFWFDPVASGKRLRELVREAPASEVKQDSYSSVGLLALGDEKALVTPEGRAILWVLERHRADWDREPDRSVPISAEDSFFAVSSVEDLYRSWALGRIRSVAALMEDETSTLRPSAAGLLFFLLLNRHTSPERALRLPQDPQLSETVTSAISGPALAFAREISGSDKASDRGIDLYRGWALGEITRRLGSDLARSDDGIWIKPEAVDSVTGRLVEATTSRSNVDSSAAAKAISAALDAYEASRNKLAALGMANERPSVTNQLRQRFAPGMPSATNPVGDR